MIRSSLHPGKTAGDLAKERNKLEVSRRIDQVPPAKKLEGRIKTTKKQILTTFFLEKKALFLVSSCCSITLEDLRSDMMHWQLW